MKKLLLILTLFIGVVSYSQNKSVVVVQGLWGFSGNTITAGTDKLGTINNARLNFITNGVNTMSLDSLGARLYLKGGLNPLLSLKQNTSLQEWQMRVGINTGTSNTGFNIYDATASKIKLYMSSYQAAFGNVSSVPAATQLYLYGGTAGANFDSRPDSTIFDETNIEAEHSDYDGVTWTGNGLAMQVDGSLGVVGNSLGFPLKNLSQLRFQNNYNIIKVTNNASLWFGTNNTKVAVLDSNGRFGIGSGLPTEALQVTGNVRFSGALMPNNTAGTSGQVLTSAGSGAVPTWATPTTGTVTSVSGTTNRITSTGGATPVIDISSSYVGQTSITTLGTVTTGTLSTGAIIAGVTMTLGSDANYDVYYRNSSGVLTRLAAGTDGNVLTTHSTSSAPTWTTAAAGTVTSVSFTGGLISVATATTTPAFTVAGTSGGIPYFSSTSTWASSALLAANALMIGGGAGTTPSTTTTGTGILTFLGTPSSANFFSAITDETGGTGVVMGNISPAITTSVTTASTTFALINTTATTINFAGAATTLNIGASATCILNFGGSTTASEFRFLEPSGSGTNFSAFKSVAQSADITYSLPPTVGAAGTVLTDAAGNGVLTWVANGVGTVTSVSVVTAQGVSGSVATATTTPAITLTLGALTGVTSYNGLIVTANTGAVTTGTWNGTIVTGTYGGTGINNGSSTITLGGSLVTSGAFVTTLTATATTGITLPTTGTLSTLAGSETLTNKTITAPIIATITNTGTLTLPTVTGTVVQYSEAAITSSSTPAPTGDARENFLDITALAAAPTFAAPSGTPANHNILTIRALDNGTARALAWNAIYRASTDLALPTTTTLSKTIYIRFMYNSASSTWDILAVNNGF